MPPSSILSKNIISHFAFQKIRKKKLPSVFHIGNLFAYEPTSVKLATAIFDMM